MKATKRSHFHNNISYILDKRNEKFVIAHSNLHKFSIHSLQIFKGLFMENMGRPYDSMVEVRNVKYVEGYLTFL